MSDIFLPCNVSFSIPPWRPTLLSLQYTSSIFQNSSRDSECVFFVPEIRKKRNFEFYKSMFSIHLKWTLHKALVPHLGTFLGLPYFTVLVLVFLLLLLQLSLKLFQRWIRALGLLNVGSHLVSFLPVMLSWPENIKWKLEKLLKQLFLI